MPTYSSNFSGLWSLALHKLQDYCLENQRVAIGVSGGADSIGLFNVFCSFLEQKKILELVVFHINFGLRGAESDGDEAFVRGLCAEFQVDLRAFRPEKPLTGSIQESARAFRLNVQNNFVSQGYIIALAHNSDDVAENVILRLSRGCAVNNAAGMTYFDGNIFRPWLDASRGLIRQAMSEKNLLWRDDSSNDKTYYTRNKIRLDVMPILEQLFPGAGARIAKSFLSISSPLGEGALTPNQKIPMAVFTRATRTALDQIIHQYLELSYGGQSPVPRQVVGQISATIHKISTGLDGEPRHFSLPGARVLKINSSEVELLPPP